MVRSKDGCCLVFWGGRPVPAAVEELKNPEYAHGRCLEGVKAPASLTIFGKQKKISNFFKKIFFLIFPKKTFGLIRNL